MDLHALVDDEAEVGLRAVAGVYEAEFVLRVAVFSFYEAHR